MIKNKLLKTISLFVITLIFVGCNPFVETYKMGVYETVGIIPLIELNGGLEANKKSDLYKNYKILLEIKIHDELGSLEKGLNSGELDFIYYPTELFDCEWVMNNEIVETIDWSHGLHALIVKDSVNSVSDLRGNTIGVSNDGGHMSLFNAILEINDYDLKNVTLLEMKSEKDAVALFNNNAVDAVIANPDNPLLKGGRALITTEVAYGTISNSIITTKDFYNNNILLVGNLVRQISETREYENAISIYSKAFGLDEVLVRKDLTKMVFIGDNIIEQNFKPIDDMDINILASKNVLIKFYGEVDTLTASSRISVNKELAPIIRKFGGGYFIIENNKDNTGNVLNNIALTKRRSESIVNYLVEEFGFDRNRFITVGNGSKYAINDGVLTPNDEYNFTSVKLVSNRN